jgi:hypothetical protein
MNNAVGIFMLALCLCETWLELTLKGQVSRDYYNKWPLKDISIGNSSYAYNTSGNDIGLTCIGSLISLTKNIKTILFVGALAN